MRCLKAVLAASVLLGGLALTTADGEAMPVQGLSSGGLARTDIESVYYGYYRGYGWRRPFLRRGFYGYGWRRPYGWRGGYGYRRGHRDPALGSRAR